MGCLVLFCNWYDIPFHMWPQTMRWEDSVNFPEIFMPSKDRWLRGRLEPPRYSSAVLLRAAWWLGCRHYNGEFTDTAWLLKCCCAHFNSFFSEESLMHKLNQFFIWNKYFQLCICTHYEMERNYYTWLTRKKLFHM